MKRWSRFAPMWLSLLVLWLLLNGTLRAGHVLLGSLLAIGACLVFAALQPASAGGSRPPARRAAAAAALFWLVVVEMVRSNLAVGSIVVNTRRRDRTAGFLRIPLELRHPAGLAVLACIVTATPGTAWARYDDDRRVLTLHILDLIDEEAWIRIVKGRYERRLLEIFE